MPDSRNSLDARDRLEVDGRTLDYFRISSVDGSDRLPFSLKVLLENLLRTEDGVNVTPEQIAALANWNPAADPDTEIQFTPARVVMQDFTGVPAVVDLATMREAMRDLGGDPARINPLAPAELVIDHSVIADLLGPRTRSNATSSSSTRATGSATSSCAGARRRSISSRSSRPVPASSIR